MIIENGRVSREEEVKALQLKEKARKRTGVIKKK